MVLENKLELGIFIDIFFKNSWRNMKHNLFKSQFLGVFLAQKTPVNFLKWRLANEF